MKNLNLTQQIGLFIAKASRWVSMDEIAERFFYLSADARRAALSRLRAVQGLVQRKGSQHNSLYMCAIGDIEDYVRNPSKWRKPRKQYKSRDARESRPDVSLPVRVKIIPPGAYKVTMSPGMARSVFDYAKTIGSVVS